jgi:hypothetical protein
MHSPDLCQQVVEKEKKGRLSAVQTLFAAGHLSKWLVISRVQG